MRGACQIGYYVVDAARAANRDGSLPAEPIHRREHLRPGIGGQPVSQFIEGTGPNAGEFSANDQVNTRGLFLP